MKIYLATDHAGFELKEKVKGFLTDSGYTVEDCGAYKLDSEDDYPDFIRKAAEAVAKCEQGSPSNSSGGKCRAVIFGGSGQGEAMVANRVRGVRAAVYYGPSFASSSAVSLRRGTKATEGKGADDIIRLSREHNNANVLSLGARFLAEEEALRAVKLWLETPFSRERRHQRRIDRIDI